MNKKSLMFALILSMALSDSISNVSYAEYSSLSEAIHDTTTPREYSFSGIEQVTSDIGNMAAGTLTINGTGAGSGIHSNSKRGITVNSGSTLIMQDIGSADVDLDTGAITYDSGVDGFQRNGGGAIYNSGTLTLNDVVFNNNSGGGGSGSAIYNKGHITSITGKILNGQNASGAICNEGENSVIDSIVADFVGNRNGNHGAAIVSGVNAKILEIKDSNFIANSSKNSAGAIRTNVQSTLNVGSEVSVKDSLFRYNSSRQGGAIQNGTSSTINVNNSTFDRNYSYNADHSSKAGGGGAIYNDGDLYITDSAFLNNATTYDGGAIYSSRYINNAPDSSVNIFAKNDNVLFSNNKSKVTSVSYSESAGYSVTGGQYNDFYGTNRSGLSLSANSGKSITFNGSVKMEGTTFDVNADNANNVKGGSYNFNNTVEAANVSIYNGAEINLGSHLQADSTTSYGVLAVSNFSNDTNGGTINVQNNHIDEQNFGNLTLNSNIDLYINSDLANGVSDTFNATSLTGDGKLNIADISLLSDSPVSVTTKVCNSVLKDAITLAISSVDGATRSYVVIYDNSQSDGGYLTYSTSSELNLVVANRNPSIQRSYVVAEDENIAVDIASIGDSSTAIGTMGGGEGAVFTITGDNNYSVIGGGKGGITINAGRTLNIENIGSLNSDNTVKAGWQGFNGVLFNNNGGTLNLTGTNVIANNSGDNSLIENTKGTISGFNAHLIGNTYSGSLVNNAGGEISDMSGIISQNTAPGLIYNHGTDAAAQIGNINNDITNNTITSADSDINGMIYNYADSSNAVIASITGTISGNTISTASGNIYGGFVNNTNRAAKSEITNISSDITSNNITSDGNIHGGLILNYANGGDSSIESISGDISGNTVIVKSSNEDNPAFGGLIANTSNGNYNATIGEISSNITNNYITNGTGSASVSGALIYNNGKNSVIDSISGEISGNTIIFDGHVQGGVICNNPAENPAGGVINSISGDIKNNYVESKGNRVNGGIVYNYTDGVIHSLTSDIENNYFKVSNNSTILNNSNGAIMNNWGTVTIADSSIKNNATNMVNIISNRGTLNIIADTEDVLFDNNKVKATITRDPETGEVTVSGGENQTVRNAKNLNLYAKSGKTITLNGQIIDGSGTTHIGGTYDDNGTTKTYDGTVVLNDLVNQKDTILNSGTLKLGVTNPTGKTSDVLKNSNFTANSGTVDVADGSYTNYNFKKLTSSADARYHIDISLSAEEQKADTFTVGSGSTGTIYLSSFSVNNDSEDDTSYILQIIKASGSTGPQLNYDNAKVLTLAQAVMDSGNILAKEFGLYTKKTTNDSIMIRGLQDTFKAWTKFETDDHKQFTFLDDANYTIADNITLNGKNNADVINNGTVVNNGILKDFTLTNNATFTNNSVIAGIVNNNGTLNLNTAANSSVITNTQADKGTVNFGTPSTNNSANVTANAITINSTTALDNASGAKLSANAITVNTVLNTNASDVTILDDSSAITNYGTINFNGGKNENNIVDGNQSTTLNFTNVSGNTKSIGANSVVINASTTSPATVFNNEGEILAGTMVNSADFVNSADGEITAGALTNNATLTSNADKININDNSANIINTAGTLILTGGSNSNFGVKGGTTIIQTDDTVNIVKSVASDTFQINKGTAHLSSDDLINANNKDYVIYLAAKGETSDSSMLSVINGTASDMKFVNVLLDKDLNLGIDVSFANTKADNFGLVDEGGGYETPVINNESNLLVDTISVDTTSTAKKYTKILIADENLAQYTNLGSNYTVIDENGDVTTDITAKYEIRDSKGYLIFNNELIKNLVTYIREKDSDTYTLTADESIADDIDILGETDNTTSVGELKADGGTFTINGEGFAVDGASKGGMTINNGQTLTVNNVSEMSGFSTAAIVNKNGTLNINGVVLTNNTGSDIDNSSILNLTGTNNIDKIIDTDGKGTIEVQSGVSTINTSLNQNNLSVISGAELVNNGTMNITTDANNAGTISGTGTLTVNGMDEFINSGTIEQNVVNISGNTEVKNSGTLTINESGSLASGSSITDGGTLVNNGTFVNNGTITQEVITNTGSFTSNASNLVVSDEINNTANLYLTGGNLDASVSGAGTTYITGDVVVKYLHGQSTTDHNVVAQAIDVAKDASLNANVGSIGGDVTVNAVGSDVGLARLYSQEENGGDLNYKVTGDGKVVFNRNVNVNAEVSAKTIEVATYTTGGNSYNAKVVVADGNTFGNSAGTITVNENNTLAMGNAGDLAVDVLNNGNLNLYSGILSKEVTGNGTTRVQGVVTIANTINDNILSLDSAPGGAKSVANMGITSVGKTVTNGGDMSLQYLTGTETYSLGDVTLTEAAGLYIDVDLRGASSVKSADTVSATSVTGSENFYINTLHITSPDDGDAAPDYAKVADKSLKNNVDLGDNNRAHVDKLFADGYMVTYAKDLDGEGGFLEFSYSDLVSASRDLSSTRVYIMGENDEDIVAQIDGNPAGTGYGGTGITDSNYPLGGTSLSVNGNGTQSIVGGTLASGVVTSGYLVGATQTLSLNNIKEFTGFSTAVTNNGTVNITDTDFTNNTTDVVNNNSLNLYGSDSINTISGQNGKTTISSYQDGGTKNADVTIKTSIVQDTVEITGQTGEDNKLTIEGTFDAKLTNGGTVDNKGTMTVNGGSNTGEILSSDDSGEIEFKGDFNNSGEITQPKITVTSGTLTNSGASASIEAEIVNNSTIENNASITANGGSNSSEIKGTGSFTVADNFTNNNSFTQNDLTVESGKEFSNAGTATINNSVSNSGTIANTAENAQLNFRGADMTIAGLVTNVNKATVNIDGSGTAELTATVTNNGKFNTKSDTDIKGEVTGGGVLENTASNLNVKAEVQQSAFTNTSGTVVVDDTDGSITTSGKISNAGTLTSNADNIVADSGISNTNTLNLTGGETQSSISGNGGTTYIKGDVTLSKTITENIISVETGGVANLLTTADISEAAKFVANGGDLNLQGESTTDTFNLGKVEMQSNMGMAIDVDLSPAGEMNKAADNITATSVSGSSLILINNLNILADSGDYIPSYAKVADGILKNNVNIGDSTRVKVDQISPVQGVNDSFIVTYVTDVNGEGGFLKFEYCDLYNAVKSTTETKAYVMTGDENVTQDLGTLNGNTLTISGNDNKITGQGTPEGISVGDGKTLSVFDVSEYSGFDTAIANAQGGTVNIENVTMTGNNTADIDNDGALNFKGTDTVDKITGEGDTVITTYTDDSGNKVKGDVTVNKSLEQNSLTIKTEDDKLTNKGDVAVNNLDNKGTIDNSGTVTTKGGVNGGKILGDNGKLNIDGEFTNNSEITQKDVTVTDNTSEDKPFNNNGTVTADTFTNNGYTDNGANGVIIGDTIDNEGTLVTDASNLISSNGNPVTNNGELDFTSGTNNNDITGSGTTVIAGDVENVAGINNDVTVNPDASLNNNGGTLGGDGKTVTNNGELANSGNISGTTVNNGTLTNDGSVDGKVVNNNTIYNNSFVNGDVTNNEDGKIANASGASITGGLDNKGVVDNSGSIISDNKSIDNSGTINNTGDLNGKINNKSDGVINTTISGMNGDITNHGNIHYTNGGTMLNDISGDGVVHLDGNGTAVLNADLDGNTLSLNNGTLVFGSNKDISKGGFIGNGGGIGNVVDSKTSTYKLGNAVLNKDTKVDGIDFDLSKLTSDKFIANFSGPGKLDIGKVKIKGNTLKDKIRVYLGDTTKVDKRHLSVKDQKLPTIMTPIRRMSGKIENNYLTYQGTSNNPNDFNPAILASPVATLIGGQITQSQTLQDSFFHMNRYMKYSSGARVASESRNRYAYSGLPSYVRSSLPETSQAMWVKPYTTFEKVNLKGGLGVSNVAYGSLYGGDTDLVDLGNGYKGIVSAFVGYNGSHQAYNGIDMNQQGGTLGVTGTLYHGNFFTGLTVSAGASAGEAYTPFGTDHFALMSAGVANKTGYNIELADGKFIIQPSLYLGYTFVNNFDYKNAAGINIDSDPLNTIQIAPGIKFIGNLDNGWQPYAGVDMMWNIMGKTRFMAADTRLPELSVKPYVQYGVGVQKSWGERFTAFFQTMLRNGGRTGIVLEGGFRWALGKEPAQKAKTSEINKTVIKNYKPNEIETHVKGNTMTIIKSPSQTSKSKKDNFMSKMNGDNLTVKSQIGEKKVIKQYYDISGKNNRVKIVATSGI